ncbi:hypothetical protein Ddye_010801 [Dipteronia dyeriana]|uniref:MULE transposase domain-containing protein n=1 Tax=Dipteronia dyeriana TaxID=168575 RepID=A0AAD9XE25_9ROSI|nr:hypothetical protein Ddye_010801 [Dipteronia dyeriana]
MQLNLISSTLDMPNTNAHLDDIQEGFTETANNGDSPHRHFGFHDTTENENVPVHEVSEPQFDSTYDQVPICSDDQFTHIQRLVPPPSYSINFGEVAPTHVDMCLAVGELFESRYAFTNRFQIKVMKSDPTRYQVRCIVEECKWRLRAAKLKEIIQDIQKEFGISCNYHKAYRAKHIALDEVQGTPVESYQILPSYLYMLEHTNLGTITDLHTDSANRFMYMFFCPKACIDGFLSSIRPVIAIDATFLKGPYAGVLFVAVCMAGNDQIFPLAFGVGDSETNEAWEWFLTRLHRAVGKVDDLVIVSDRKNSIITGVEKVFPKSFHGAYAVRLERNMLRRYGKNKVLKDIFRKVLKVYRVNQFTRCMEQLASINSEAAMYITDVGFEWWARAYSPRKRYNLTSSNIAEAMNNAIKVCRELPITGVIDCIREVLQRWFSAFRFAGDSRRSLYLSSRPTTQDRRILLSICLVMYDGDSHESPKNHKVDVVSSTSLT